MADGCADALAKIAALDSTGRAKMAENGKKLVFDGHDKVKCFQRFLDLIEGKATEAKTAAKAEAEKENDPAAASLPTLVIQGDGKPVGAWVDVYDYSAKGSPRLLTVPADVALARTPRTPRGGRSYEP